MKKLFAFLSLSFLSLGTFAAPLPGTRYQIYDSVGIHANFNVIVNLTSGRLWCATKESFSCSVLGNVIQLRDVQGDVLPTMTWNYDSILNGVGKSFASAVAIRNYLGPHKPQSVDQPAQDSLAKVYVTGVADIYQFLIINPNTVPEYIKIYDAATVINSHGTTPIMIIAVQGNGSVFAANTGVSMKHCNTGFTIRCTNAIGYTDSSEPVSNVYISIRYRGSN